MLAVPKNKSFRNINHAHRENPQSHGKKFHPNMSALLDWTNLIHWLHRTLTLRRTLTSQVIPKFVRLLTYGAVGFNGFYEISNCIKHRAFHHQWDHFWIYLNQISNSVSDVIHELLKGIKIKHRPRVPDRPKQNCQVEYENGSSPRNLLLSTHKTGHFLPAVQFPLNCTYSWSRGFSPRFHARRATE